MWYVDTVRAKGKQLACKYAEGREKLKWGLSLRQWLDDLSTERLYMKKSRREWFIYHQVSTNTELTILFKLYVFILDTLKEHIHCIYEHSKATW